jgi:hypothetical protein
MAIDRILNSLKAEQQRLENQLKRLNAAIASLRGAGKGGGRRRMSAAGRARIAAAQRKRWAKIRAKAKRK